MKCGEICARSALTSALARSRTGFVQIRQFQLGADEARGLVGRPDQIRPDGRTGEHDQCADRAASAISGEINARLTEHPARPQGEHFAG